LAINVYKVSGSATPTNIILRWGEAQAWLIAIFIVLYR
jgi:hypothetical protein